MWRISQHLVKHLHRQPLLGKAWQRRFEQAQASEARIGDDQYRACPALAAQAGKVHSGTCFAENLRGARKTE
ncbi:hypothetical protein D3C79_922620 [compost metagenome]